MFHRRKIPITLINKNYLCVGTGGFQGDLVAVTATPSIKTTILKGVEMQS